MLLHIKMFIIRGKWTWS